MDHEIWQQLFSLESRDITQQWYKKIHGRKLNARRAKEINAASRQAREYFRNARNSYYSVRPLLTFYGVASLSRALLLLLKAKGGEEGLTSGHGLETVGWGTLLSGEPSVGLESFLDLKVRTCSGLFSDFLKETKNRISIHVHSSSVDWRLSYDIPALGEQISLADLFARIPDLKKDYTNISEKVKYAAINEMTYSAETGFQAKVSEVPFKVFNDVYVNIGYDITCNGKWCDVSCDAETFSKNLPLFIHSYIHKTFNAIPVLYIAEPFPGDSRYSQLGITYIVAYFLGMLVRYYPTHWISLIQGAKGDALWPTINRAQQFVERSYPELVIELIYDVMKENKSG